MLIMMPAVVITDGDAIIDPAVAAEGAMAIDAVILSPSGNGNNNNNLRMRNLAGTVVNKEPASLRGATGEELSEEGYARGNRLGQRRGGTITIITKARAARDSHDELPSERAAVSPCPAAAARAITAVTAANK